MLSETRTSIWDGMDRVDEHQSTRNLEEQHYLPGEPHANETLLIIGPFDSGTNLMKDQLFSLYPRLMHNVCAEHTWHPGQCGEVWKHGVENGYNLSEITASMPNLKVVIMVRSPLSLLASWKKAPYQFRHCMNTTWSQMANATCTATVAWTATDSRADMQFHGVMDIYNHYMRQYNHIAYHSGITAQMVAYEDLVYSPELVTQAVAERFGWPVTNDFTIIEDAAKWHGDAVGREGALEKLRSRSFLADFTEEEKQLLCTGLDEAALEGITEGTYLDHPLSYSMDCHNA